MLEDYQNKVCVVTGAASGIGKALCEKLVALGAQVYALDRNKADIEGLSAFVETDYCAIIGLNQKDLENQGILA